MPQISLTGRKMLFFLMALLLAASLAIGGCSSKQDSAPASGGAKPIELKLAHFWPSTHWVEAQAVKEWAKAVESATGGSVKITSYPAETLLKSTETYDGVVKGVADIGMSCYAYNRGRFPVMETFMVPGIIYNNSKVASMVASDGAMRLNPKELQDTKHLMIFSTGPGDLFMKAPVKSRADLKGVEIGVTGGPRAEALKLLGATPVVLAMPECYEAQSKGVIKGTLGPVEVLKGFKLGEVTSSITRTPFLYNQVFYMVMNKEKWESLPPDIKEAITRTTEKFHKDVMIGMWDKINDAGMKWTEEKKKVEIYTLPEAETKAWLEAVRPVMDEHVKMLNGKGIPGDEVLKTARELADKYNKDLK
ncbi:MAG: TRAP transporter substrate-binding protein [Bacillota bacterium]